MKDLHSSTDTKVSKVLLFGDDSFNDIKNTSVLTASSGYMLSTKSFDVPLHQN